MTNETAAPNPALDAGEIFAAMRRGLAMLLKVIMGGMVVLAAGIMAVSLAMVGLILAAAAVVYRFIAGTPQAAPVQTSTDREGVILDARQTPHGWTVE